MGLIAILGSGLALAMIALGAMAADRRPAPSPPPQALPYAPQPTSPVSSFVSELRIGGSAHDPWGPEKGSANLSGEILLAKPFTAADLFTSYFIPRPHLGASLNAGRDTSFGFAGLSWTLDVTPRIFVEGSLGGAIHDGRTDPFVAPGRAALGCSPLFREAGSVGVRLSANWSLMATLEHLSNAGTCRQDKGLTNLGARLGYTF